MSLTAEVDLDVGLDPEGVVERRSTHGANRLTPLPTKTWADLLREAFDDAMVRVLIVAALISTLVGLADGEYVDGIAISVAVVVVTTVGTLNQLRAQRDYTALEAASSVESVRVIRGGSVHLIDAEELVVGDVVEVNVGDIVAADLAWMGPSALLVSEAQITGEPETEKAVGDPLYTSTRILDGSGRGVVQTVGDDTEFGRIRQELAKPDEPTPLEARLDDFARQIGVAGSVIAVVTFIALIGSGIARNEVQVAWSVDFTEFVIHAVTVAITIVVVTVPEGLPLAVTLCLAYTTRRMADEKALVRKLAACETMGSATVVCTDKTGTLTEGQMALTSLLVAGRDWVTSGPDPTLQALLSRALACNTTADLVPEEDGGTTVAGNATEGALLRVLSDWNVDYLRLRHAHPPTDRIEFNSERKFMQTAIRLDGQDEVHLKGAPEMLVERCRTLLTDDGVRPLEGTARHDVETTIDDAAARGDRVLALATTSPSVLGTEAEDLTLLALAVLADPLRPEVPDSVARCVDAGLDVMIITGDVAPTATEIGRQAGIVSDPADVLMGESLRAMDDEELADRLPATRAVARALPEDKRRIAALLREAGEVVAMTGDGVNDAPALVAADVGFAMGSGSKVAREAGDVVIVDDDFTTIVRAIRWGRSVFQNIRRFLVFQLTVNVVALGIAFTAALAGFGTPLTAVQLLWVNLIMDSLAALALTLEPPADHLFDEPPTGRGAPLVSPFMWRVIIGTGLFMFAWCWVALGTDLLTSAGAQTTERSTVVFTVFVLLQVANAVNARTVRPGVNPLSGLAHAPWFATIMGAVLGIQVLIVSFGGSVFHTEPLSLSQWLACAAVATTVWPAGWVVRRMAASVRDTG